MSSAKTSVVTIYDRIDTTKAKYGHVLEQIFWGFVLTSWVPVFYALALFPSTELGISNELLPIVVPTLDTYGHPILNFANFGVVAGIIIALIIGRPRYLYCLLFPLFCNLIPTFSDQGSLNWEQALTYGLFLLSFILSLATFIRFGHLLSPSFGLFSLVLILDASVITIIHWNFNDVNIPSVFELAYSNVAPNLPAALLFLISAVLWRVVYLAVEHNRDFFSSLFASGQLLPAAREALKLWLPMPIIFLVATAIYAAIFSYSSQAYIQNAINYVQENGLVDPTTAPEPDNLPPPTTTEEATVFLERAHTLTIKAKVDATATNLGDMANENVQLAADEAVAGMRARMPTRAPGTETRGCGWLDLKCHFMNLIKSITNSIYQSVRRDFLSELDRRLNVAAARAQGDIATFRAQATAEVNQLASLLSQRTEVGLKSSFQSYYLFSWVILIYSIIILIKTYLIVFARVIFNTKYGQFAVFEPGSIPRSHGQIGVRTNATSNELKLPTTDTTTYFVSRKLGLANHPQSKRRPKPLAAIFTRIANRAWVLNRVDMSNRSTYAGLTVSPPNSLVEWQLKKDERVIFWFNNFGAMSGELQIDRVVTLSVAGLVFGRMIYYCAQGPGKLILRTNNPAIVSGQKAARSYTTPCFVAWDTRCRFKVDANLTINDTFRSGVNVKKSTGDNVIVDTAPDEGQKMTTGILTYVTSFLLPI